MRNRFCRSIVALCCVVLAGGLACSDSTAPDPNATLFNRVRGTYELSVVLNSFTYVSCPTASSSNPTPTCHDTTVALNGHPVRGSVTLTDTVPASTFTTSTKYMYFEVPAGTLTVIGCDTCSSREIPYPATTAVMARDGSDFDVTLEPSGFLILQGQIANDEISGDALSATYLGTAPHDTYTGTFTATRQP